MNSLRKPHIIVLIITFLWSVTVFGSLNLNKVQDSLSVDNNYIESRVFSDLKSKYQGDEFTYDRTIKSSGWWTRFKQWLIDFLNIKSGKNSEKIIELTFWIFASIIFLLAVFFLFKAIINKEGYWVFRKSSQKNIIPITDLENNIYTTDFKTLITEAESTNNYRLAIRYYYLWLLKTLSNAKVIDYDVEKTNTDYYFEIDSLKLKKQFSYMAYLYNYIWYGEFNVSHNQFSKAKLAFNRFINTLNK